MERSLTLTRAVQDHLPPPLRALLGACVLLGGCSLSMPTSEDFFRADVLPQDEGGMDAGDGARTDASSSPPPADGGADANFDAGVSADAGSDADVNVVDDAGTDAGEEPAFDPTQGLVLHYRFNESTGNTVHDFAGDNDALVVGTPAGHTQWVAAGRVGGALDLAGGSTPDAGTGHYVELPQGVLLGLEQCSISLWLNRSGGPMWQRVFDLGSGQPVWLFFTPYGGTALPVVAGRTPALIFVDFVAIDGAPEGEGLLKITKPIPVSTWVHFVLTWSGQEVKAYLDGKLVASAVTHGGVTPSDLGNTGQNYLGRSQFETDPYFDGLIDEFRIYDRVLSANEVAELHALQ